MTLMQMVSAREQVLEQEHTGGRVERISRYVWYHVVYTPGLYVRYENSPLALRLAPDVPQGTRLCPSSSPTSLALRLAISLAPKDQFQVVNPPNIAILPNPIPCRCTSPVISRVDARFPAVNVLPPTTSADNPLLIRGPIRQSTAVSRATPSIRERRRLPKRN